MLRGKLLPWNLSLTPRLYYFTAHPQQIEVMEYERKEVEGLRFFQGLLRPFMQWHLTSPSAG